MEENLNENVKKNNGFGITGLILGGVSIILSFVPTINAVCVVFGLLGIVFSIIGICTENKKAMPIIGLILSVLSLFILFTVNMNQTDKSTVNKNNTSQVVKKEEKQKVDKFTLVSADMVSTKSFGSLYDTYITGEIKNNTNKKYSYVSVTFILYDEDGSQIGTAIDSIFDLEPNGTWKFKATTLEYDKVSSFKLSEISGH